MSVYSSDWTSLRSRFISTIYLVSNILEPMYNFVEKKIYSFCFVLFSDFFLLHFFKIRYFLHLHFQCYLKSPPYPPSTPLPTLSHFLALAFPCTEAYKVCKSKEPLSSDGQLGHLLIHMHLETRALGVLVSSYCCSTYKAADPFSSLGTFSSSSIGGPVFHPIDDCEHPRLYLPGTGIASQDRAISGSW